MSDSLVYVKPKNKLKAIQKREKIKLQIVEKIQAIPQYQQLKNGSSLDNELILFVCNCIENLIKPHAGIDKKDLVVEIISCVITLSPQEKDILKESIQFLFDNGMIKKVKFLKKLRKIVIDYIKRKLG